MIHKRWHPAHEALAESGVTQTAVAKRAKVAQASVNHMLADDHPSPVSPRVRKAIVDCLADAGYGRRNAEALFEGPR